MIDKNKENFKFAWRITAAHTIAYFCAGIFALYVIDYKNWFSDGAISSFMLPTDTPIVALGPALQIIRGLIMALVLLPLRKVFTDEKYGFLKLGFLILGLSLFSTFAAAMGSLDGFIYTNVPILEQIMGYPEAFVWTALFIVILWAFYKFEKKVINITAIVLIALIVLMSIMGYLDAEGIISTQN
jgi:hypothetical protein